MSHKHKGTIVVLHLAFRYPFAGVVWQLLHHLVAMRQLGFDVYYLEDNGAYVYDPVAQTPVADASQNLALVGSILARYGFAGRWAFVDPVSKEYVGMSRERCLELLANAGALINLCGASALREEHTRARARVYLETDPGAFQVAMARRDPATVEHAANHNVFFSYGANIGKADCALPAGGLQWHSTRPPVLLDEWHVGVGPAEPAAFTTVGTWRNKGNDVEIAGDTYFWSKHVNFVKMLEVASRARQPIELSTDLNSGPDYERALKGGFTFRPVIPMSLDIDRYREYISGSRGEFTVAKDLYARTRSGWFSDRTVCYLAAGRPVVTQFTGFEKFVPAGIGLLGFNDADQAVAALQTINADYRRHARAAREIAVEYFDAIKLLEEMATVIGL